MNHYPAWMFERYAFNRRELQKALRCRRLMVAVQRLASIGRIVLVIIVLLIWAFIILLLVDGLGVYLLRLFEMIRL